MQLVIFDCDGVLVNSEDLADEAHQQAYAEYGVDFPLDDIRAMFTGLGREDYLRAHEDVFRRVAGQGVPAAFHGRLLDIFNEKAQTRLCAIDGIPELLQALTDAGVPFCVASNSGVAELNRKLEATGLYGFFDPHIYSREHVARGKPAPDLFLYAARETGGIDPAQCIVVEDSRPGVQAGVAAGMHVIGFGRQSPTQGAGLMDAGAKETVTTGNELKQRIFQLLERPLPPARPAPQP